jgi:hypothetical protein
MVDSRLRVACLWLMLWGRKVLRSLLLGDGMLWPSGFVCVSSSARVRRCCLPCVRPYAIACELCQQYSSFAGELRLAVCTTTFILASVLACVGIEDLPVTLRLEAKDFFP